MTTSEFGFTGERMVPGTAECAPHTDIYKEHIGRYQFACKFVKNKTVLDIACGVGYGSRMMVDAGAEKIHAGDIDPDTIEYAKVHYNHPKIGYQVMDANTINHMGNSVDCVVSFETIEHVSDCSKVLNEFARILKPNGVLIISTPNKDTYSNGKESQNEFHFKEFTPVEFKQTLAHHFNKVDLYSQRLKLDAGAGKQATRKALSVVRKLDVLNLRHSPKMGKLYAAAMNAADDSNGEYEPVPYQQDHLPMMLVAVCEK